MRLADFIDANLPTILTQWDLFAATLLPAAGVMYPADIRDHAEQMLQTIAKDLRTPQTRTQQLMKSQGEAKTVSGARETAAQTHALARAASGFSIRQLVAEYRALRASVLRAWADAGEQGPEAMEDVSRFNEAIDQAITESVDYFTAEVERWRDLMLGTICHDLRGPLNAMMLTSQLVAAMSVGRSVSQHVEKLKSSGERMKLLLDDLLDYNRSSLDIGIRITRASVNLGAVCHEEIALLRAAFPEVTIEYASEDAIEGNWDASRIKQALSNLVTNSAKYGDPNGIVRVSLSADDSLVHLAVDNTGPSIPPELIGLLFEPLRRFGSANSDGERESMGLGLFIVRQIALAHRGDVTVESGAGKTRFTISLPRKEIPQSPVKRTRL